MGEGILRFLDEVVGHFGEKHDFIPQSNAKTPYGRSGSSLAGEPQCPPALGLGFGSCGRKLSPSSRLQLAQGCWGCSLLLCVSRLQVQHEHGAQGSTVYFHSPAHSSLQEALTAQTAVTTTGDCAEWGTATLGNTWLSTALNPSFSAVNLCHQLPPRPEGVRTAAGGEQQHLQQGPAREDKLCLSMGELLQLSLAVDSLVDLFLSL